MQRKNVSRDELDAWLTQEILAFEDCNESTLSVQYVLVHPDAEGCNWSGVVAGVGPDITAEQIQPIAAQIVKRARVLFNIAE